MNRVYKYPISRRNAKYTVMLPEGFKFLRVGFQGEQLQMWCEVNPDARLISTDFQVYGTGHDLPVHGKYVTTYDDGPFVFHIYQVSGF